jgi:uncharacterized membrane protein YdjX (TVP38/TMEM64 family)
MEQFLLSLVYSLGYLGVFLLGLFSSATIFIPTPAFIIVFLLGATMNPVLLGFLAGLGSAIGEMSGYLIGRGGERVLLKKYDKKIKDIEKKFEKHGSSAIIFIFSAGPLPFDLVGLFCGALKYPFRKFFIATLMGKLVKYWAIAFAGFYGIEWILHTIG